MPPLPRKSKKDKKEAAIVKENLFCNVNFLERFDIHLVFLFFEYLTAVDYANFSMCSQACNVLVISQPFDSLWFRELGSERIDEFSSYFRSVDDESKLKLVAFHSARKVVSALCSSTCSRCGCFALGFCALTCSRYCDDCFMCKDSGPRSVYSPAFARTLPLTRTERATLQFNDTFFSCVVVGMGNHYLHYAQKPTQNSNIYCPIRISRSYINSVLKTRTG